METPEIKINVNRIYFEDFPAPCGEPERTEIRLAWERAVIDVVEDIGFSCNIQLRIGHDPKLRIYVNCEDVECDESHDGECYASVSYAELAKFVERYGAEVAERAIVAGDAAAQKESDHYVAEDEHLS